MVKCMLNGSDYTKLSAQNFAIPKADHSESATLQDLGADIVPHHPLFVLRSIEFHD